MGGKSFGCSQTCVSGPTRPSVISAQKGQADVPSRRLIRCGAFTRYCRKMGFQIKGVVCSICSPSYTMMPDLTTHQDATPLSHERGQQFTFIVITKEPFIPGRLVSKESPSHLRDLRSHNAHNFACV